MLYFRHMAKTVEESLLGDHSDQWMDSDCPEAKRIKVSYTTALQFRTPHFSTHNIKTIVCLLVKVRHFLININIG